MEDINKITHTKVGDNIHFYVNGQEGRGTIVKMSNSYVSVLKESGSIDEIHINDTFFVKDILTNKTWNSMNLIERTEELQKAHAFSPRFLSKNWEDLPQELRDVLAKTNIEESTHGQLGGNRAGVSTDTDVKTPEDYKGESNDDKKEEFKHEKEKPKVEKNNGIEEEHDKEEQTDATREDWRPTGGEKDKNKNYINKKFGVAGYINTREGLPSGGDHKPIGTQTMKLPSGNAPTKTPARDAPRVDERDETDVTSYGNRSPNQNPKGRGQKKLTSEGKLKSWEVWLDKMGEIRHRDGSTTSFDSKFDDSVNTGLKYHNLRGGKGKDGKPKKFDPVKDSVRFDAATGKFLGNRPEQKDLKHTPAGRPIRSPSASPKKDTKNRQAIKDGSKKKAIISNHKQYGKVLYGVTSLEKEGDGAGNSGINSTDTTGVYNARYSDNHGRYRDQQRDTNKKGEEKDDGRRSRD